VDEGRLLAEPALVAARVATVVMALIDSGAQRTSRLRRVDQLKRT
jgi:hypothetical protein